MKAEPGRHGGSECAPERWRRQFAFAELKFGLQLVCGGKLKLGLQPRVKFVRFRHLTFNSSPPFEAERKSFTARNLIRNSKSRGSKSPRSQPAKPAVPTKSAARPLLESPAIHRVYNRLPVRSRRRRFVATVRVSPETRSNIRADDGDPFGGNRRVINQRLKAEG